MMGVGILAETLVRPAEVLKLSRLPVAVRADIRLLCSLPAPPLALRVSLRLVVRLTGDLSVLEARLEAKLPPATGDGLLLLLVAMLSSSICFLSIKLSLRRQELIERLIMAARSASGRGQAEAAAGVLVLFARVRRARARAQPA